MSVAEKLLIVYKHFEVAGLIQALSMICICFVTGLYVRAMEKLLLYHIPLNVSASVQRWSWKSYPIIWGCNKLFEKEAIYSEEAGIVHQVRVIPHAVVLDTFRELKINQNYNSMVISKAWNIELTVLYPNCKKRQIFSIDTNV